MSSPPPAARVTCPKCAAKVPCYDPVGSRYFGCFKCRTYFRAVPEAGVGHRVEGFKKALVPGPNLPLGATATLGGYRCRLTGYQVRGEKNDRVAQWREYQLRPAEPLAGTEPADFPLQLAEYHGHWLLVRRATNYPFTTGKKGYKEAVWVDVATDRTYKLWHRYQPTVRDVQGEFDWNVLDDEKLFINEFTSPPYLLVSEHLTSGPPTWYQAEHLEPAQVAAAFGLTIDQLPSRQDVGAAQPNPVADSHLVRLSLTMVLLLLGLHWLLGALRPSTSTEQDFNLPDTSVVQAAPPPAEPTAIVPFDSLPPAPMLAPSAAQQAEQAAALPPATPAAASPPVGYSQMLVSDAIVVSAPMTLTIDLDALGLTNHWVEVTGSLVNEQTGRGYEFTRSLEYYEGVEDGESWSEGSRSTSAVLSGVPAGRYHLNLYPSAEPGTPGSTLHLRITQEGSLWSNFWLVLLVLLSVPLFQWWRYTAFETSRWENSNFGPRS